MADMAMDETRWQTAWYLLSLDMARPFFPDLWLGFRDPSGFRENVRRLMEPALRADTYGENTGLVHWRLARWFSSEYGDQAFFYLCAWVRDILMVGGGDRAAEGSWSRLIFTLGEASSELKSQLRESVQAVAESLRIRNAELERRIAAQRSLPSSEWDERIIQLDTKDSHAPTNLIFTIGIYNNFVLAWHSELFAYDTEALSELHNAGRLALARQGGHASSLPFPGYWGLEMKDIIATAAAGGVSL